MITDIRMPPLHTEDRLRAAIAIRPRQPGTAVLVLSQYVHRHDARELFSDPHAGTGYLLKQGAADVNTFCRDVQTVGDGGAVLDSDVVSAVLSRARRGNPAQRQLTPRQTRTTAGCSRSC